ncbi:MAG TPA: aspartate aminotransferase family protein, partial [Woeseiaceae bacterium]|nr:aspartate aminotransferase family protein [Woeseiaceae bacterium]
HPAVLDAIRTQIASCAYAHTAFFTNAPQETLAGMLAARFPDPSARVYFVSGGSEANEAAIKLARQYWVARGQERKRLFVSRQQSYHGNTLGALSLSGNTARRQLFGQLLHEWPKVSPCYEYRHREPGESPEEYGRRAAASLRDAIASHGAENIAAFVAETIVGATLGAVPAVPGYFREIRNICTEHEILLIADEVMAGCGRSGTYFAFEQENIVPDIVTIAKGLGGGYQPIGAAIARGDIHEQIVDRFGSFAHGHTYVGHATACAAGVAIASIIQNDNLLDNVQRMGARLRERLATAFGDHPHVGDIRGRGLLVGIELVVDRAARTPPAAVLALPARLRKEAMTQGLVCYPGGGTADGSNGAHILLAPPFIYSEANVDELVTRLGRVLQPLVLN